jgi:hypothetical protein
MFGHNSIFGCLDIITHGRPSIQKLPVGPFIQNEKAVLVDHPVVRPGMVNELSQGPLSQKKYLLTYVLFNQQLSALPVAFTVKESVWSQCQSSNISD